MSVPEAPPRRSIPWVWVGVVLVMLFAGLRQWLAPVPPSPFEGRPAPDLSLPLAAPIGDRLRLTDLRGEVVLLEFWATWCGACRQATPRLNALHKRYDARGARIIGINTDAREPGMAAAGHRSFGARFPTLLDPQATAQLAFDVQALPTLVLIDRQGVVRRLEAGVPDERDWAGSIAELLR